MKSDHLPDGSGSRQPHPLDLLAPASVRDALADVFTRAIGEVMETWRREFARSTGGNGIPISMDLMHRVLDAYVEILRQGRTEDMETVFQEAAADAGSHLMPAATADSLHHLLSTVALAALPSLMSAFPDQTHQQQAIGVLLGAVEMGVSCLYHTMEQTAALEVQAAQERQLRFYQDITRLATNNRLRLVEPEEIPAPQGMPIPIQELLDGARLRRAAASLAHASAMETARTDDLTLAVGEAVSNVLKHAGNGLGYTWRKDSVIYVFVTDTGRGITLENLPKALTPGWSSEPSLGMGFTLMLEMADAVWLSTSTQGTTVCLEKSIMPPTEPLLESLFEHDTC